MFKTLVQILLALNDLRTELTEVSEVRMQVCGLFQLRADFVCRCGRSTGCLQVVPSLANLE